MSTEAGVEPDVVEVDDRITVRGILSSGTQWMLCESPAVLAELRDQLDEAIQSAAEPPIDGAP